ncbi:hypothetical protein NYZ21_21155, partial [Acinetobacter baumannii]|nr:hypothetical protein [Acinetobacter baumannii]
MHAPQPVERMSLFPSALPDPNSNPEHAALRPASFDRPQVLLPEWTLLRDGIVRDHAIVVQ